MRFRPIVFFFILSLVVILSWFKNGLYYGGAEVGLSPYYNPARYLNIQQFIWWADVAPGSLVPQFISAVPLYFILSILQNLFSPLILQTLLFFCLLFLMGYGMYLFANSYIGKEKYVYSVIAGLFYMLNSYMMVEVWHRFLYTGIFLAAFLPINALFWKYWLKSGAVIHLTAVLLTSLISSYMFGNLTSFIAIWIIFFLLTAAEIFIPWQGKKKFIKVSYLFIIGLILFVLTNLWWLIPVVKVSTGILSEQHSSEDNISTLINISKQTILPYTLQYANPFYLFYTQELGSIYSNSLFRFLPWLPMVVIFVGIVVSLKNKIFASFGLLYLVAILIAKGVATPFGYPYVWGFMHIFFIGIIRNPLEKLGILLPFLGSPLFVIGLEASLIFISKKFNKSISWILGVSIILSILIYAQAMFSGMVFNKPDYPLTIKVPDYYKEADQWLEKQKGTGNILHLPFSGKDVVTYDWEKGYHGVEINEILFTALPSITRNIGIKRIDDTIQSLSLIFNPPFSQNKQQILKLLQSLNIQYIVLHKDTRWNDIATYGKDIGINNPSELEKTLNNLDFLEKIATFDKLVIYQLENNFYQPKMIISDTTKLIYPGESNIMKLLSQTEDIGQTITLVKEDPSKELLSKIEGVLVFPQSSLDYSVASESALISMANSMILNPNNSDLTLSKLKVMKNTFSQNGELTSEEFAKELSLANDSIIRFFHTTPDEVDTYYNLIKKFFISDLKTTNFFKSFKTQIADIFYLHLYILDQIGKQRLNEQDKIMKIENYLINNLKVNNLLPLYIGSYYPSKEEINRKILQVKVPIKSQYELVILYHDIQNLYPKLLSNLDMRINDKPLTNIGKIEKNDISFGNIDFDKGTYEISFNSLLSTNLVPSLQKFLKVGQVESQDFDIMHLNSAAEGVAFLESPIKIISGGDIFKINIEALFKSGAELYLEVITNTEDFDNGKEFQTIKSGECSIHSCYLIKLNSPYNTWQKYTFVTPPLNLASQKANIRILAVTNIQNSQQMPTDVLIRNFEVKRVFNENIVLKRKLSEIAISSPTNVRIDYKTPVMYSGKITIDKPAFLFFKETFNPGWTLKLSSGQNTYNVNNHYLGSLYGNSYYIDKTGNFDYKLEFEPQKNVGNGLVLSILGWIGILITLVYTEYRRKYGLS